MVKKKLNFEFSFSSFQKPELQQIFKKSLHCQEMFSIKNITGSPCLSTRREWEPPAPGHCSAAAVCLLLCSSGHQQPQAVEEEAEGPVLPGCSSQLPCWAPCRQRKGAAHPSTHPLHWLWDITWARPGASTGLPRQREFCLKQGSQTFTPWLIPCLQVIPVLVVSCSIWHQVSFRLLIFPQRKKI